MALQVWLPLNKSGADKNQGLANINIVNNASYEVSGKLGGCYKNGTINSGWGKDYNACLGLSASCWINIPTVEGNNIILGSVHNYPANTRFYVGCYNGYFSGGFGNTTWGDAASNRKIESGTWYHLCMTTFGTNWKLYINGQCVQEKTSSANPVILYGNIYIGEKQALYNDFRIYNHCLSPKEVKEISRGMVLHYKMCGNVQIPNNCYSNPTFDTSNSNGGWSHWTTSGGSGSFAQNTDKNFIFRSGQTYSHKVVCGSSATYDYLCYQEPAFSGGYRSMCAIIKASDDAKITENICYPTWNSRNGGVENNKWTSVNKLRDGFYLCKCEGIKQNGSNDLVGIYVKPGKTIYISECYLENNYERCSDFWTRTDIEYDGSGFKNHGTVSGNVTLSADSPRYIGSYLYSDSTSGYISVPQNSLEHIFTNKVITISLWINPISNNCRKMILGMKNSYNVDIEIKSSNDNNIRFYWNKTDWSPGISCPKDTWTYLVFVIESNSVKIYKNGSLAGTKNSVNWPTTGTGEWLIGSDQRIGTYFLGSKVSDFRIYSTALDATDVAELYKLGK